MKAITQLNLRCQACGEQNLFPQGVATVRAKLALDPDGHQDYAARRAPAGVRAARCKRKPDGQEAEQPGSAAA